MRQTTPGRVAVLSTVLAFAPPNPGETVGALRPVNQDGLDTIFVSNAGGIFNIIVQGRLVGDLTDGLTY